MPYETKTKTKGRTPKATTKVLTGTKRTGPVPKGVTSRRAVAQTMVRG